MKSRLLPIVACLLVGALLVVADGMVPESRAPSTSSLIAAATAHHAASDARPLEGGRWETTRIDEGQSAVVYVVGRDRRYCAFVNYRGETMTGVAVQDFREIDDAFPFGTSQLTSHVPWIGLMLIVGMFVVAPLSGLRRFDAAVAMMLPLSLVAFRENQLYWAMALGVPALLYLGGRAAWQLMAPVSRPSQPPEALLSMERAMLGSRARAAALAVVVLAAAALTLFDRIIIDVGQASLAGASLLLDGDSPYTNIPWVFHGDTYPILAYVAYVPAAIAWPAYNQFSPVFVTAPLMLLYWAGAGWAAYHAALRLRLSLPFLTTIAIVLSPSILLNVASGNSDVVLALCLLLALGGSMWWLALGAWVKVLPAVLIIGRLKRDDWWIPLVVSVGCIALVIAFGGFGAPEEMVRAMSFQVTRGSAWDPVYLIGPMFSYVTRTLGFGLVLFGILHSRSAGDDPRRWLLVMITCMTGLQAVSAFWNPFYVGWLMPLLILWLAPSSDTDGEDDEE